MAILESIPVAGEYKFHCSSRTYLSIDTRIELVSGIDVGRTYENNHPATVVSCMKGKSEPFFDAVKNLRLIRVVSGHGGNLIIHLRALMWDVKRINTKNESAFYIDRVYSNCDWAMKIFNLHWKKWGKLRHGTRIGTIVTKMKRPVNEFAYHLDTFITLNNTRKELCSADINDFSFGYKYANSPEFPKQWRLSDDYLTFD